MSGRWRQGLAIIALALMAACTSNPPPPTAPGSPGPTGGMPAPTQPAAHHLDGTIDLAGLRHNSRDMLYRTPPGAVPAGTPVTIRLRTFAGDVSAVQLRAFGVEGNAQQLLDMDLAASAVDCYEAELAGQTCDFWSATLPNAAPDNIWYRFIVHDGAATAFYADDTPALDGGLGSASQLPVDNSWALTVYVPGFVAPAWARDAVVYQIFPDRFRNGDRNNDPQAGDPRYDDPVVKHTSFEWNDLPEGYCRRYADAPTTCPRRYDGDPAPSGIEQPHGRDWYGGDLRGVIEQLDYLAALGVTAIYLNPIFDAASNHGYDTRDYSRVNPYFGSPAEFDELVAEARDRGIRIILDGVFNHMSSDSPFFDRYGRYDSLGACEATTSSWRAWFSFQGRLANGPCLADDGTHRANYASWAGVDSLPVLNKRQPDVLDYFVTGAQSITRLWLERGASGWRLDASPDPSFPSGWWESFRTEVKALNPDALTISETWQKNTDLLRALRGDRFDTSMNYRLRDAVLGLLAPQPFDAKGFPASGGEMRPSAVAARLLSMQEDYPPAAYYELLNLIDSHDTARALWALTPGTATRAEREFNAANVSDGKQRLRLAALLQFSLPGMPTIYYGDEVGVTGSDDPDDRRTYPWADLGGQPDTDLLAYYTQLGQLRAQHPVLTDGDLRLLLADDRAGVLVLGRRTAEQAAVVLINRGSEGRDVAVPVAGFVPNGTAFDALARGSGTTTVEDGVLRLSVGPLSGVLLVSSAGAQLRAPAAPAGLMLDVQAGQPMLQWQGVSGAAGYDVWRSPLTGGGWLRMTTQPQSQTSYSDTTCRGACYYVVTAVDAVGNESGYSTEAFVALIRP
jgi:glycosidase